MTRYGGGSSRRGRTLLGAALAVLVGALAFMTVGATPASASTNHVVTLGLADTGVNISAGDSVTFEIIGGAYQVDASVGIGTPVTYSRPGTYRVSWKVQKITSVLGPLGKAVDSLVTVATCAATVVVAPVVAKVSSAVSKVTNAVPKVHVSVSVPRVRVSAPGGPTSSGAGAPAAPASSGSSTASGQAGKSTTAPVPDRTANVGGATATNVAGAAGVAPTTGAAMGGGGGYANNAPAGSNYVPVSMNQPDAATADQQHKQPKGDARAASAFGSARLPVLLAILAIIALLGVTVGYARVYVFGRLI